MRNGQDLVAVFLKWIWLRALFHNGWWLVTSVYLVVDAHLSASQLVLIGVAQGLIALVFEIPTGVVADTISRKWSLVVSHILMGVAMIATGCVTNFGLLVATQMLWGLSWNFASGADVAWITDELDDPARISVILMRSGRAQLTGAAAGILGLGGLAALTHRSVAMVIAGMAMLLVGLYVVLRFPERRFVPASTKRWSAAWSIFVRGFRLAQHNRILLLMFVATLLVNGAEGAGRLFQRRLVDLGLPANLTLWFTALGVLTVLAGAIALRVVEPHIDGSRAPRRGYITACATGAVGLFVLACAPEKVSGSAAVLLVSGIAMPLTRTIGGIWVNRQTSGDVRATVHSFLAQAEYTGEIVCGLAIAAVAQLGGLSEALMTGGALFAITALLVQFVGSARDDELGDHDRNDAARASAPLMGLEPAKAGALPIAQRDGPRRVARLAVMSKQTPGLQTTTIGSAGIPVAWLMPEERLPGPRPLALWMPPLSASKEHMEPYLRELAEAGFIAISLDPWQHGARALETPEELCRRVFDDFRTQIWPILGRTTEDAQEVISWATSMFGSPSSVSTGGISMGGDIAVALAGADHRVTCVAAIVSTADWLRPGMRTVGDPSTILDPGVASDLATQCYDRHNPITHTSAYSHLPAMTFECGAIDHHVPPDGAQRFVAALRERFPGYGDRLRVTLHEGIAHSHTPPELWMRSLAWLCRWNGAPS